MSAPLHCELCDAADAQHIHGACAVRAGIVVFLAVSSTLADLTAVRVCRRCLFAMLRDVVDAVEQRGVAVGYAAEPDGTAATPPTPER